LPSLQQISRRKPVRDVVIGFGNLPDFRRELLVSFRVLTLRAETDGENWPHAVDLRMLLQDHLEDFDRVVDLAFVEKHARREDSDQRVLGFGFETLSQLTLRFVKLALVHENARAIVT